MSDHGLLAINPACGIRTVGLFDGHRCVVVDDFLADPMGARSYALSRRLEFLELGRYYPGPELPVPGALLAPFDSWWKRSLCKPLGLLRGGATTQARFSIITKKPQELPLKKRFCHQDPLVVHGGIHAAGIAGVLYLFHDPQLGGTSFFRKRENGSFAEIEMLKRMGRTSELAARYPFLLEPPRYMLDSNPLFERMGAVAAQFNRAVFYDRSIFHSPDVTNPDLVTAELSTGRLTMNFFVDALRAV